METSSGEETSWARLSTLILCFACAWQLVFWLLQRTSWLQPPHQPELGTLCCLKAVNMLHALVCGPAATWVLLASPTVGPVTRAVLRLDVGVLGAPASFGAYDARVPWVVALTVGFFLFDVVNVRTWESVDPLMVAHHLLSITVWPIAVHYRVAYVYLLIFISSELSSPLLQGRWMARTFSGKDSKAFKSVTMLFGLSFLCVRSWTIPFVEFALWVMKPWAYAAIPRWVNVLATATLPLPAVLNALWTVQIIQMALRKPKKDAQQKAS
jgi:hypothetical protein